MRQLTTALPAFCLPFIARIRDVSLEFWATISFYSKHIFITASFHLLIWQDVVKLTPWDLKKVIFVQIVSHIFVSESSQIYQFFSDIYT